MNLGAFVIAMALPAVGFGQDGVLKDQFLKDYPAGTLAIVADSDVNSVLEARRLLPLEPNAAQPFGRRSKCIVALAHREPDLAGKDTFVGIQIIKLFTAHISPGVVYVKRNPGWISSRGTANLPELQMSEVYKASLSDFASGHSDGTALDRLAISKGKLSAAWHAKLDPKDAESDSASEANLRFWAENPMADDAFKSVQAETIKRAPYIRVENHLVRFKLTAGSDPSNIPTINFDCRDARLAAVAMRAYLPFSSTYSSWGHLEFK